jgi:hypothetical protein
MISKPLKIAILIICAIISIILAYYVYRMFFLFSKKKTNDFITAEAEKTNDPDKSFKMITEGVEFIKQSPDLVNQVKLLAEIDVISKEEALVKTAVKNCFSSGMINFVTETTIG